VGQEGQEFQVGKVGKKGQEKQVAQVGKWHGGFTVL
jgi:hypothetical protein